MVTFELFGEGGGLGAESLASRYRMVGRQRNGRTKHLLPAGWYFTTEVDAYGTIMSISMTLPCGKLLIARIRRHLLPYHHTRYRAAAAWRVLLLVSFCAIITASVDNSKLPLDRPHYTPHSCSMQYQISQVQPTDCAFRSKTIAIVTKEIVV